MDTTFDKVFATDIGTGTQLQYQTDFVTSTHATGSTTGAASTGAASTGGPAPSAGLDWILIGLAVAGVVVILS